MNPYIVSMIILLLLTGSATSWYEIKKDKFGNTWIFAGVAGGFFLTALFFIIGLYDRNFQFVSARELILYAVNFALVSALGFLLWRYDFLEAGIAKLVILYAALIPLEIIQRTYVSFFPTLVFLINTFLLVGAYFVGEFIFFWLRVFFSQKYSKGINMKPGSGIIDTKENMAYLDYVVIFVGLLAIIELMQGAHSFFVNSLGANYSDLLVIAFVALFLARRYVKKMMGQRIFFVLIVTGALVLWGRNILLTGRFSWTPLLEALVLMLVINIFNQSIFKKSWLIFKVNVWRKEIPVDDFSSAAVPGMFFWENFLLKVMEHERSILQKINIEKLTSQQAGLIKKIAKEHHIDYLAVQKEFPLAIWMLAGAAATILARGPLTDLLLNLSGKLWKF